MAGNRLMRWFAAAHLPPHLRAISEPIGALAAEMDRLLPECAEKTAGLRKLLEAKDCLVRAAIEKADADRAAAEDAASVETT